MNTGVSCVALSEPFAVLKIDSKCGSRFEAHVRVGHGTKMMNSVRCTECGEILLIPDLLLRPLVKLG
jgi:hypothetical protein